MIAVFTLFYMLGFIGTAFHQDKKFQNEDFANPWDAVGLAIFCALSIEFWPVYWACRLVAAPIQLMLPPPGEGV